MSMIYKCENCQHRHDCHENKAQYKALSKVIESALQLDKENEFHCWFGLNMKCDYFDADKTTLPNGDATCGGNANG